MLFAVFLTALFVSMLAIAGLVHVAPRLGLVDRPDSRKVHRMPIPRCGGVGMVLGVVIALLTWREFVPDLQVFLLGAMVISIFGIWDDRSDLGYSMKFTGQLLAIIVVVGFGDIRLERIPFLDNPLPPPMAYPLTVFFLLGTTNAMNLSDGLDGLASGLGLLSLGVITGLAYLSGSQYLIILAAAIMGAIIGFLRFNTLPAKVFMGDTGSQFLGFSLGMLSLSLTQDFNTALNPVVTFFVLGLPIIDTLTVMAQRVATGCSPFRPDRNHFHHKLMSLGFDHYEAVVTIYGIQLVFVAGAFLLRYESDLCMSAIYTGLALSLALFYPVAHRLKWNLRSVMQGRELSPIARVVVLVRKQEWPARVCYWLVSICLLVLLPGQSLLSERIPRDAAYLVVVLALVAATARFFGRRWVSVDRLAIYSCVILATYGLKSSNLPEALLLVPILKFFDLGLLALMAISIRFSNTRFQYITPSDYLFLFILITAGSLPRLADLDGITLTVETAITLYAAEFVLRQPGRGPAKLRAATVTASLVLLSKAF